MKKRKLLFIGLLVMLGIIGTVRVLICKYVPVTIVSIPKDIKFTDEYNPEAYLCLPAAYTSTDGKIEGSYRIGGRTQGRKSLKEYVSIHPSKGLIIRNGIRTTDSSNMSLLRAIKHASLKMSVNGIEGHYAAKRQILHHI